MVDLSDRVMRPPIGPEPIRARLEVRLENRLQHQFQSGLDDPVGDGGNPQLAHLPDPPGFGILRCRTGSGRNAPAFTEAAGRPGTPGPRCAPRRRRPSGRRRRECAPPVARDPVARHDQRRRIMHEVEQVIEPAARIGRRPTVKLGLHLRYPRPGPTGPLRRAPPFSGASFGIAASFPSRYRCRPSPCAGLSPARSTTAAPPHPARSAVGAPIPATGLACPPPGSRDRVVPMFTVIRSTKEEPDCVPAASPRVRRSPSPWPPGPESEYRTRSSPPLQRRVRTAPGPDPPGSSRCHVKDVKTPVPRVLLSVPLAGPAPSGSTGTSRLCQGCSRPPRHHPDQAAPSFTALLRQDEGEGLSPPHESQRLTAPAPSKRRESSHSPGPLSKLISWLDGLRAVAALMRSGLVGATRRR